MRFGRFEILQVYNYLVDNPSKPGNPINRWKDICLKFVNETADVTSNRHLPPSGYKYEDYVTVYKRLLYALVELRFGGGSYTLYTECVKQSILEKGQGLTPHRDHPGFCMRKKQDSGASQAASPARPRSVDEYERAQSQSRRGPDGRVSEHYGADYAPRQGGRSRSYEDRMEEEIGHDRAPVGGMGGHASDYAHHEPTFESQYPGQGRAEHDPRRNTRSRPPAAPMGERIGRDRVPVGRMDGRATHHEPPFDSPYAEHDQAEYGRRHDPWSRPYATPMEERVGYDRVPVGGMGGRVHHNPEREPAFEPPYYAREPIENRASRQRRATFGEADWTESDVRGVRNGMAGP